MLDQNVITAIVILVLIVGVLGFLWYKGKKKEVLEVIDYFVNLAEEKFGNETGEYKYGYVIKQIYPKLPSVFKVIISPEILDNWIEFSVNKLQEGLEKEIKECK